MFKFLKDCLKEKGQLEFKENIIKVCEVLLKDFPVKNYEILSYFAEYLEDSFSTSLSLQIIHIFSNFIPFSKKPKYFLKFLINRLALAEVVVRTATVSCLGILGQKCPVLKDDIKTLLLSLKFDMDEEVSERS